MASRFRLLRYLSKSPIVSLWMRTDDAGAVAYGHAATIGGAGTCYCWHATKEDAMRSAAVLYGLTFTV